jgi:hypothetical protein
LDVIDQQAAERATLRQQLDAARKTQSSHKAATR